MNKLYVCIFVDSESNVLEALQWVGLNFQLACPKGLRAYSID